MSFIAAFRGIDSLTFGADTQETVGGNKVYVEKIHTIEKSWGSLLIGGAGNGELCDAFVQAVKDEVSLPNESSMSEVEQKLRDTLRAFYKEDVAYAARGHHRIKLLIGASIGKDVALWQTKGQRLISVSTFGIVGYDAPIYRYFSRRLEGFISYPSHSVLAMAYLVGIAKETGEGVGFDSQITVLRDGRAYPEPQKYIDSIASRIQSFHEVLDRLYFMSMDFAVDDPGFKDVMRATEELLLMYRSKHMHETARMVLNRVNDPSWKGDAYPKLPPGIAILKDGDTVRLGVYVPIQTEPIIFVTLGEFVTAPSKPEERASTPTRLAFVEEMQPNHETQTRNRER